MERVSHHPHQRQPVRYPANTTGDLDSIPRRKDREKSRCAGGSAKIKLNKHIAPLDYFCPTETLWPGY